MCVKIISFGVGRGIFKIKFFKIYLGIGNMVETVIRAFAHYVGSFWHVRSLVGGGVGQFQSFRYLKVDFIQNSGVDVLNGLDDGSFGGSAVQVGKTQGIIRIWGYIGKG